MYFNLKATTGGYYQTISSEDNRQNSSTALEQTHAAVS